MGGELGNVGEGGGGELKPKLVRKGKVLQAVLSNENEKIVQKKISSQYKI